MGGDPESGTINYRYDAAGNMVWRDDNMGRQTCYSYDALNRVTQKIYFTGNYATQGGNCAAVPGSAYLAILRRCPIATTARTSRTGRGGWRK